MSTPITSLATNVSRQVISRVLKSSFPLLGFPYFYRSQHKLHRHVEMWRPALLNLALCCLKGTRIITSSIQSTLLFEVALICSLQLKSYTNSIIEEILEMCFAIFAHVLNTASAFTQPFTARLIGFS